MEAMARSQRCLVLVLVVRWRGVVNDCVETARKKRNYLRDTSLAINISLLSDTAI